MQGAAFSSSHLSLVAWLVRHPISGTCDYPHGYGFYWFVQCLCSLPETFRSLRSGHAQGLGNYHAVGIWLAQADRSLPCGGLISPCSIVVLTSTQVLSTASIVGFTLGRSFTVDVNEPRPNRPNTINLVKEWVQELGLSKGFFSSRTRPYGSGIAECVEKG